MYNLNMHRTGQITTRLKKDTDNLILHPPGLRPISLPFHDKKLPVCLTCKRNYKTREICRTRDEHTDLPWSTTYICITIENNCFDNDRNIRNDVNFEATSLETRLPFCFTQAVGTHTPICHNCKVKNYTRHYCREKLKHRQLPWSSAYLVLAVPAKVKVMEDEVKRTTKLEASPVQEENRYTVTTETDGQSEMKSERTCGTKSPPDEARSDRPNKRVKQESGGELDEQTIFSKIPESSTFLAIVSSQCCTYQWLVVDDSVRSPSTLQTEHSANLYNDKQSANQTILGYGQDYHTGYNYPSMYNVPGNYPPSQNLSVGQWGRYVYPSPPEQNQGYTPYSLYPYNPSTGVGGQYQANPHGGGQFQQSHTRNGAYPSRQPLSSTGGVYDELQRQYTFPDCTPQDHTHMFHSGSSELNHETFSRVGHGPINLDSFNINSKIVSLPPTPSPQTIPNTFIPIHSYGNTNTR